MTDFDPYQRQWLRRFHPATDASAGVRMVCFPHAGGSALYYRAIFAALGPSVSVYSVQYPGRQDRIAEPCIEDLATLSARIFKAVLPLADRPLVFFGHSMGALVAYEVALELERVAGTVLDRLVVSGRVAPSQHPADQFHRLGDQAVIDRCRAIGGSQSQALDNPAVLELIRPALIGDWTAVETYRPEPGLRLHTPIHGMVGDDDPVASIEQMRAWQDHTTGPFDLQVFPGGHFYLDERPDTAVAAVGALIPLHRPGAP
jgi:surfactin synthase thioesterase subunit